MKSPNVFTWVDAAGTRIVLSADMVKSSEDDRSAELTQHAAQDGSQITDHIIRHPDVMTFELLQSQTPIIVDDDNFQLRQTTTPQRVAPGTITVTTKLDIRESAFQPPITALLRIPAQILNPDNVLDFVAGQTTKTDSVTSSRAVDTGAVSESNIQFLTLTAGSDVDRVRDFHDTLIHLLDNPSPVDITFRGYTQTSMALTRLSSQSNPNELGLGRFVVEFQKFTTVTTQQNEELPDPSEVRLKRKEKAAAKAAKKQTEEEKTQVNRSILKQLGASLALGIGD